MFRLYGFKSRSRAERVLWALQELVLPYEMIRLDFTKGETLTKDFLALNPSAKVPVLVDDEYVLTESVAIMRYLDDVATDSKIIPQQAWARYEHDKWLSFAVSEVEPYLWIADQAVFLSDQYHWPQGAAESALIIAEQNLRQMETLLETRGYAAGSEFSSADIVFYHLLSWAGLHGITFDEHIMKYLQRLAARPAFPPSMAVAGSPAVAG